MTAAETVAGWVEPAVGVVAGAVMATGAATGGSEPAAWGAGAAVGLTAIAVDGWGIGTCTAWAIRLLNPRPSLGIRALACVAAG